MGGTVKPPTLVSYIVLLFLSSPAAAEKFVVFDPDGSTSTIVSGINAEGAVTGWSLQGEASFNSFIRAPDGTLLSFNLRHAGKVLGTQAQAINADGVVTGTYYDEYGVQNGFIRAADGKITKVHGPMGDLRSLSVNDQGDTAGYYWTGQRWAGFIGAADGALTIVDPPDASLTCAFSINDSRFVTGSYVRGSGTSHGFLFSPDGHFADITPLFRTSRYPGALFVSAINGPGQITGQYETEARTRGYLRGLGGSVSLFDVPNARATRPTAINDDGAIAGIFLDASDLSHGFVRGAHGRVQAFDPPGSSGTTVSGINIAGIAAGSFSDGTMWHGFVRAP